jgi:uncharacterized DUF497 family protein
MEFEWNAAKHAKTMRERGIGFDDGARIFAGRIVVWRDERQDYGEARFRAVGVTDGVAIHVAYTIRGVAVRIISVRRANRKELAAWRSQERSQELSQE